MVTKALKTDGEGGAWELRAATLKMVLVLSLSHGSQRPSGALQHQEGDSAQK